MGGLAFPEDDIVAYPRPLAYDAKTLALRWTTDLSSFGTNGPLTVSIDKDDLYVGMETQTGGAIAVLSASTGEVRWLTRLPVAVYSSPAVTKEYLYVGSQNGVWVLNKVTGQVVWVTYVGPVDSSPAVDKDFVYVTSSASGIDTFWTLDAHTGQILFSTQLN